MLAGPTAAPTLRWPEVSGVEELLAHEVRGPVEELLLRAVRWVGRATAAESPEGSGNTISNLKTACGKNRLVPFLFSYDQTQGGNVVKPVESTLKQG